MNFNFLTYEVITMKFKNLSKRIVAALLVSSSLFLACSCVGDQEEDFSNTDTMANSDLFTSVLDSDTEAKAEETKTEKKTTAKKTTTKRTTQKVTEKPQVAPSAKTKTPAKSDVNGEELLNALKGQTSGTTVYSIAVSTTDGIKVAAVKNADPQNSYSVSKAFCVTAIGMLYDEGKIKMTDTIGNIFKDEIKKYGINENKWKNITVHDVLKHKIGYTKGSLLDIDVHASTYKNWDSDYLKLTLSYETDGKETYRYSDAAYYLISRVVAKISGQKLDAYLKTRLFDKADFKNYSITKCPQGHPIGATQFFLRPDDMVKLGRIYLNGGTYNGKRIISQEWVNMVIDNQYEFGANGTGYSKGGMNGQFLYINFKHNVAAAWLSKWEDNTWKLGDKLKSYMK